MFLVALTVALYSIIPEVFYGFVGHSWSPIRTNSGDLGMFLKRFPMGTDIGTVRSAAVKEGYYASNTADEKDGGWVTFTDSPCSGITTPNVSVKYDKDRKTQLPFAGSQWGFFDEGDSHNDQLRIYADIHERLKAELGDKEAQYYFACLYTEGEVMDGLVRTMWADPDATKAVRWWRKLAEGGNGQAQLFVGNLYSQGKYINRDYAEAYYWYSIAAKSGDKDTIWLRDNVGKNLSAGQKAAVDKRVGE